MCIRDRFYPTSIFPPTDFHTATLVGDSIWIIGGLGYAGERKIGKTPVHRLNLNDFSIHRVDTSGELPGWINRHQATLTKDGISISGGKTEPGYQDNTASFILNLDTFVWEKQPNSGHS